MISISEIIRIIIQKNTLCTKKMCDLFLPKLRQFFARKSFFFFFAPPVCAPTVVGIIIANKEKELQHMVDTQRKNAMVSQCSDSIYYVTLNLTHLTRRSVVKLTD